MATRCQRRAVLRLKIQNMVEVAKQYGLEWKDLGPEVKQLLIKREERQRVDSVHNPAGVSTGNGADDHRQA